MWGTRYWKSSPCDYIKVGGQARYYINGTLYSEYNSDTNVEINGDPYAWVSLVIYDSETDAAQELEISRNDLSNLHENWRNETPFYTWGNLSGQGITATFEYAGDTLQMRIFVASIADQLFFELREIIDPQQTEFVAPGLEQIEDSFEIVYE